MKSKTWLLSTFRQPRYSYLSLLAFTIVLAGVLILVACISQQQLLGNVLRSPLPRVKLAEEKVVPDSVAYHKEYEFTTNWFTWNIPIWEKALEPFKARPNLQYLEIGLHEGRSAIWMLENVLTDKTSRLTGLDVFTGPVKDRYFANIKRSGSADRVTTITGYSQETLRGLPLNSFDIVYIDGSHAPDDVLEDAVLSWRLLKDGGILIFDDYRWYGTAEQQITELPKEAIDAFIRCFEAHCEVIHNSFQLILRKKVRTEPHA